MCPNCDFSDFSATKNKGSYSKSEATEHITEMRTFSLSLMLFCTLFEPVKALVISFEGNIYQTVSSAFIMFSS